MGIGSVTSTNNISNMRMFTAGSSEPRNKSIQNEIINVQQQMQSLSTKEELSVNEKMNERKKLQNELASLNTELKQHQQELRRSQNREIMMAKLRKDSEPATDETAKDKTQADEASRIRQTKSACLPMSSKSSKGLSYCKTGMALSS